MIPKYKEIELPDTLGELMKIAIADARAAEAAGHELDMETWVSGRLFNTGKCAVCLAGAVMLNRVFDSGDTAPQQGVVPSDFPLVTHHKLRAIDCLRMGNFGEAWALATGKDFETEGPVAELRAVERRVLDTGAIYEFDHEHEEPGDLEQWWETMEVIRDELLAEGI